jgi:hypothetical protein
MSEHFKNLLDTVSLGVAVTAFIKVLPALASLASLIWTGIRVYEWWKGKKDVNQRLDQLDS